VTARPETARSRSSALEAPEMGEFQKREMAWRPS